MNSVAPVLNISRDHERIVDYTLIGPNQTTLEIAPHRILKV